MQPFINTYTNRRVNPLDIVPGDVSVLDIAHSLALCNRFAGHTCRPISVAQHCVWVSRLCDNGTDYEIPMAALLHDASESFLGDITKWLKGTPEMKPYRDAEERATRTVLSVFECEDGINHQSIDFADKLMVCWEAEQGIEGFFKYLMPPGYEPVRHPYRSLLEAEWDFIHWGEAKEMFLARFSHLQARRNR